MSGGFNRYEESMKVYKIHRAHGCDLCVAQS